MSLNATDVTMSGNALSEWGGNAMEFIGRISEMFKGLDEKAIEKEMANLASSLGKEGRVLCSGQGDLDALYSADPLELMEPRGNA